MDLQKIAAVLVAAGLAVLAFLFIGPVKNPWEGLATGWGSGNTSISACGYLNDANQTFTLTQNVSVAGATCFTFNATNQTLNCAGFSITGDDTNSTYAAYTTKSFSTIANCTITLFDVGIYFSGSGATDGAVINSTVNITKIRLVSPTYSAAIFAYNGAHRISVINNTANSNAGFAMYLSTANNAVVRGNVLTGTSNNGLRATSSSYNSISNNTLRSNTAMLLSASDFSNISNNVLNPSTAGNCINLNNGCDNNTIANNTCNAIEGSGFNIGSTTTYSATGNIIMNNTMKHTGGTSGDDAHIKLHYNASRNTLYWNNFTIAATAYYIYDYNGSNFYNTSVSGRQEGNIYYNVNSSNLTGTFQSSGFPDHKIATSGTSYPYNNSTSGNEIICSFIGCGDYAPLFHSPNSAPTILYEITFANSTRHNFTATAGATDADGAADINATNASTTLGNSAYVSNSTAGNNFNATFRFNSTVQGTATVTIGFTDSAGNYVGTATAVNSFPDTAPNITKPTVNATLYATSTATCTNGTFADPDGDTENISSRVYAWFKNGAVQAGQTATTLVLSAVSALKGDNISCSENVTANNWTSFYAYNTSTNTTISNSVPGAGYGLIFANYSTAHSFNASAGTNDSDGASDINATNSTVSFGSCSYASNSTSGNTFNSTFTCTATSPGSASIRIGFTDKSGAYYSPTNLTNTYPDHAASLTTPTVSPTSPVNSSILTCNSGTYSDLDGDTENASARTWKWYKNGTLVGGQTNQTLNLSTMNATIGQNYSCWENTTNSTWTSSWANASSTNVTVVNVTANLSILYQTTFANASSNHTFTASAGANQTNGASWINKTNISTTAGACVQISNASAVGNFNATYRCTPTVLATSSIVIGFSDNQSAYVQTTTSNNTYPDHAASLTAPSVTPTSPANTSVLTCNNGTFTDLDSDTENTSARTWKWYRNGTVIAGQTNQTLNLSVLSVRNGENFSCWENVTNSTWSSSWANASSTNVTVTNGTLNATFGTGINRIRFTPVHAYQTGVEPVNQTSTMPLFNVSASSAGDYSVSISTSPVITGFTLKCAPYYNKSGIVTLTATAQSIVNFTYPPVQSIWCWADFSNPTVGLAYNISVVSG